MRFLVICLGGVGGLAVRWWGAELPYGTLIVNVTGSFLIGLAGLITMEKVRVLKYDHAPPS